jgi:hypothetical protein
MGIDQNTEDFVRNKLGCDCPDEVFEKIEHGEINPAEGIHARTITVGGRLLIYIWHIDDPSLMEAEFSTVFAFGKDERDRRGLNRFRAVLSADNVEAIRAIAEPLFQALVDKDEKIHLHVVATEDVAAVV